MPRRRRPPDGLDDQQPEKQGMRVALEKKITFATGFRSVSPAPGLQPLAPNLNCDSHGESAAAGVPSGLRRPPGRCRAGPE